MPSAWIPCLVSRAACSWVDRHPPFAKTSYSIVRLGHSQLSGEHEQEIVALYRRSFSSQLLVVEDEGSSALEELTFTQEAEACTWVFLLEKGGLGPEHGMAGRPAFRKPSGSPVTA